MSKKIFVTRPALPPLDEFEIYLKQIWKNSRITNNGPFHVRFEKKLADYLNVDYISVFSNGTSALIAALKALQITGEVITTPFSFVATSHSIWWCGLEPVFVDIEPEHLNMDPNKIERAITSRTSAILPVHVYGNPCRMEEIQHIADRYNLKVIYDAAHAFGVKQKGRTVLNFGDLSVLSFHATKAFNTIEGGAVVCHTKKMKRHLDNLKNFGFRSETIIEEQGINAKMNELQSAYGLLQLKYVDGYMAKRKAIADIYRLEIETVPGICCLPVMEDVEHTYPYFPVLIDQEVYGVSRDGLYDLLKRQDIYTRRYFYPLISQINSYRHYPSACKENLPVAEKIAEQILCLPIYPDLDFTDLERIIRIIRKNGVCDKKKECPV